jgi:hypothetical protein
VATTAFWCTFNHEGKISPGWWGGDALPPPFIRFTITSKISVYAPAEWADTLMVGSLKVFLDGSGVLNR